MGILCLKLYNNPMRKLFICTPLFAIYTEQQKTSHAYLNYVFTGCECCSEILIHVTTVLREVFGVLKMYITTEASKFMSEDKGSIFENANLSVHFKGSYLAEMINTYGISIF